MTRRLVLIGGGHAHIEFIRRFGRAPIDGVELIVLDPSARPVYSGMVPGVIAGMYEKKEVEIDLAALCARAGARFLEQEVTRVDAAAHTLALADASTLPYDFASLDVGSTVAGLDAPGVRHQALASRPIRRLIDSIDSWVAEGRASDAPHHVIGGGAAGIELAFCVEARLAAAPHSARRARVEIVTAERRIASGAHPRLQRQVERALAHRGIGLCVETRVCGVTADAIELTGGGEHDSAGVIWVTGPAAHPLTRASNLPCDEGGFVRIRPTLQVEGVPDLFAVGDCASMPGLVKAGVHAVRAAPVLDANLRARLRARSLRDYIPQRDFLSLLNLGNGTAIGSKWGVVYEGRAAMKLKDRIDRAFMERYR